MRNPTAMLINVKWGISLHTMVMTSQESMKEYFERTSKLVRFFIYNHRRAKAEIIEDSPVDYITHKFICSIQQSESSAILLMFAFGLRDLSSKEDYAYEQKLVKELHLLEEELATQNELLDSLASTHTARAGDDK